MFYSEEQYEEYLSDMAPAPTLADEHAFWHLQQDRGIISRYASCPLDCGAGEIYWDDYEEDDPV